MSIEYIEPRRISDVVKYYKPEYSVDDIEIVTDKALEIGAVLGRKADGKFMLVNPSATTGEQIACAVLTKRVSKTGKTTALRRLATVADRSLEWPENITDSQKVTAVEELAAFGIIARREV